MLYCFPVEPLYSDFMYRGKQINNIQSGHILYLYLQHALGQGRKEGEREGTPS